MLDKTQGFPNIDLSDLTNTESLTTIKHAPTHMEPQEHLKHSYDLGEEINIRTH